MNSKRIAAFFIDFLIVAILYEIPFYILVMIPLIQGTIDPKLILPRALISVSFAYLLFVFKDIFKRGSIGKMIMKLKIIDSKTKEEVSAGKRILRNITWIISWIEFIVYFFAHKRIGDLIARTDVVPAE